MAAQGVGAAQGQPRGSPGGAALREPGLYKRPPPPLPLQLSLDASSYSRVCILELVVKVLADLLQDGGVDLREVDLAGLRLGEAPCAAEGRAARGGRTRTWWDWALLYTPALRPADSC